MTLILGTFAYPGSGQDTFAAELAKRRAIDVYSTGDAIRSIARERGLPFTRENLQDIRREVDRNHDRYFLPLELTKQIKESDTDAIITGIRTREEYETFKGNFEFYLFFVYADELTRYQRLVKRAEAKDPTTFEEFIRQSDVESAMFDLRFLESVCDYTLDCGMSIDAFLHDFDSIIRQFDILARLKVRSD